MRQAIDWTWIGLGGATLLMLAVIVVGVGWDLWRARRRGQASPDRR